MRSYLTCDLTPVLSDEGETLLPLVLARADTEGDMAALVGGREREDRDILSVLSRVIAGLDRAGAQSAASLIPVDDALAALSDAIVCVPGVEEVALSGAVGRVLSDDARAETPVPPFDNAAVDGYAACLPEPAPA